MAVLLSQGPVCRAALVLCSPSVMVYLAPAPSSAHWTEQSPPSGIRQFHGYFLGAVGMHGLVFSVFPSVALSLSLASSYPYPFSLVVPCQQLPAIPVFHLPLATVSTGHLQEQHPAQLGVLGELLAPASLQQCFCFQVEPEQPAQHCAGFRRAE